MALTFLWISAFIFLNPLGDAPLLFPWVIPLLPFPLEQVMRDVAVADAVIGILFLMNRTVWYASVLGTLHLLLVFAVTGVNAVTVRNIGLIAATITLGRSAPFPAALRHRLASASRGRPQPVAA